MRNVLYYIFDGQTSQYTTLQYYIMCVATHHRRHRFCRHTEHHFKRLHHIRTERK